jgi:hypothetical protein
MSVIAISDWHNYTYRFCPVCRADRVHHKGVCVRRDDHQPALGRGGGLNLPGPRSEHPVRASDVGEARLTTPRKGRGPGFDQRGENFMRQE